MSSSIGKVLKITLFGESHSKAIGLTIDGFPSGIKVNYDEINKALARRNPKDVFSTERQEPDEVIFLSPVSSQNEGFSVLSMKYNMAIFAVINSTHA